MCNWIKSSLVIVFLFVGTSCSLRTPPESGTPDQQSTNQTAGITGSEELEGDVVITIAVPSGFRYTIKSLIKAFHRLNPSITVQMVTPAGEFSIWSSENLRWLASVADTNVFYGTRDGLIHNASYFLDLMPLSEADRTFEPGDFWPGALSACQDAEGRIVGIPISVGLTGIFFDPAVFDAAGLPHPAPGWTLDDFQQAVSVLARAGSGRSQYSSVDGYGLPASILAPVVGTYLASGRGRIEAAALGERLQWYLELASTGNLYPLELTASSRLETFWLENERPAMWVGWPMAELPWGGSELAIETYEFAPFPVDATGGMMNTTLLHPLCAVVSAGTEHPRAAWAWVSFLTRQWLYSGFPSNDMPVRRSVAEAQDYWDTLPEKALPAVHFGLEHGWYGSLHPQAFKSVSRALTKALRGEQDLSSALMGVTVAATPTPDSTPVSVAKPKPTEAVPESISIIIDYLPARIPDVNGVYKAMAEAFQREHPNIYVNLETEEFRYPGGDPFLYLSGSYDCFAWGEFIESDDLDLIYSLNPLVAEDDPDLLNDFYPGHLEANTVNGESYALPASSELYLMQYNADLLADLGLQLPAPDWTFDDFLRQVQVVASSSGENKIYGFVGREELFFVERGVRWVDLSTEPPQLNFDQPEVMNTAVWVTGLAKEGVYLPVWLEGWKPIYTAISSGQAVFWIRSTIQDMDVYIDGERQEPPEFEVRIAPIPQTSSGQSGVAEWLLGKGQYISHQAENPQACWMWMKFLSEQVGAFPGIPARRSVLESSAYAALVGTETAAVHRVAQSRSHKMTHYGFTSIPIYQWKDEALIATYEGADPILTLSEAQHKAETYITCLMASQPLQFGLSNENLDDLNTCAKRADPDWQEYQLPFE